MSNAGSYAVLSELKDTRAVNYNTTVGAGTSGFDLFPVPWSRVLSGPWANVKAAGVSVQRFFATGPQAGGAMNATALLPVGAPPEAPLRRRFLSAGAFGNLHLLAEPPSVARRLEGPLAQKSTDW